MQLNPLQQSLPGSAVLEHTSHMTRSSYYHMTPLTSLESRLSSLVSNEECVRGPHLLVVMMLLELQLMSKL